MIGTVKEIAGPIFVWNGVDGMTGMGFLGILLGLIVIVAFWAVSVYNRLVRLFNLKEEGWSGIDVQLKRRFDLVPNLVETVKGYATHEKETLQRVVEARAAITRAGNPGERIEAENALTSTLRSLFAVAESYPELKANVNFLELQKEISSLENDLQMARRYYNGTVRDYNTAIQGFPAVMIARKLGYSEAPYFTTDDESRSAPKVSFS